MLLPMQRLYSCERRCAPARDATPAPVIDYESPSPVFEYFAPAPSVSSGEQFSPACTMEVVTTGVSSDTTCGLANS